MIGVPEGETLEVCGGPNINIPDKYRVKPGKETKKFIERFAKTDKLAVELLKKMLQMAPNKRISIKDALEHDFFKELHCEEDEPTTKHVSAFDFDFEKYELSISETAAEIYEEILLYHSAKAQKEYISNRKKYPKGMLYLKYDDKKDSNPEVEDVKSKMKALLAC